MMVLIYILPSPSLSLLGLSGLLILGHLEELVRQAFGVRTVGLTELGNVHHIGRLKIFTFVTINHQITFQII